MKYLKVACLLIIGISLIDCKVTRHKASKAHNAAEKDRLFPLPVPQGAALSNFHPEQSPSPPPTPAQATAPPPTQVPSMSPPPAVSNPAAPPPPPPPPVPPPVQPPAPECNTNEDCLAKDPSKPFCLNGVCAPTQSGKKKKKLKQNTKFFSPQNSQAPGNSPSPQNSQSSQPSQNSPTNAPPGATTQPMTSGPSHAPTNGRTACKSNDDCKNTNTPYCVQGYCSATSNGKKHSKKKSNAKKHGKSAKKSEDGQE